MSYDHKAYGSQACIGQLGGHDVSRIGFGAMQLEKMVDQPADAVALLSRAVDLGVDHVDTAQFYGNGFANEIIRQVLANGQQLVVATKVGADPDPGAPFPIKPAQRPEQLRASVENNLRSLGVEQLAFVNLRRLDVPPGLTATGDQIVDIDDQLAELTAMRNEGKIGSVGLSAVSPQSFRRAIPAGIVCVQNAYSLLSREQESLLDVCEEHGIAWVPFFPLGSARFSGWPSVVDHPKVRAIAATMDVTSSQLGLAWLLAHRPNILLIPGTSDVAHLEENIAAATIALSKDVLSALVALGAPTIAPLDGDAR